MKKWYGFEMSGKNAELFREYLIDYGIEFEPSEAYNLVHFECKMSEEELNFTTHWIKKTLLSW